MVETSGAPLHSDLTGFEIKICYWAKITLFVPFCTLIKVQMRVAKKKQNGPQMIENLAIFANFGRFY